MSTLTDKILSDFIDAWNAGERPRVLDFLARAPDAERDALAELITTWLELAPAPEHSEATRAAIREAPAVRAVFDTVGDDAGLWPELLPRLRSRSGLSLRDVAAQLLTRFGLGTGEADRTTDYLGRLERGELEPARVSRRLLDALGETLGAGGATLRDAATFGQGLRPAAAGGALFRGDADAGDQVADDIARLSRLAMREAPAPMDELDRLFTGGPDA